VVVQRVAGKVVDMEIDLVDMMAEGVVDMVIADIAVVVAVAGSIVGVVE
jgi:hypothetical protein